MDLRGYLHSNGNNCTGKSRSLFSYRTSKGVMLVKSTDALIHFDYTRYFHYYRIRKVREALIYLHFFKWMAEKGKAIPSTPTIHTIEPRDFCLFSALLTLRDDARRKNSPL